MKNLTYLGLKSKIAKASKKLHGSDLPSGDIDAIFIKMFALGVGDKELFNHFTRDEGSLLQNDIPINIQTKAMREFKDVASQLQRNEISISDGTDDEENKKVLILSPIDQYDQADREMREMDTDPELEHKLASATQLKQRNIVDHTRES